VVARVDGEPIFRQYQRDGDRHWLRPLNAGYPKIEMASPRDIIGVVVQRAGTRRSHRRHYL